MTDLQLVLQPVKRVYVKLELLNDAYIKEDEIQGDLMDFSITVSAESDIRRVASATMFIANNAVLGNQYFGAWMDKMVQMHYGIYDPELDDIRWFLLGSFLFTTSSYTIDVSNKTLSVQFADMMSTLTEQRGSQIGYMSGYETGSSVKNALDATISRFSPYKRTNICEFDDVVPYDVDVSRGSYPIQLTTSLVNLWPWYEQFYSKDGVYTVQPIPTTMNDPVVMNSDEMKSIVISENGNVDYSTVKNCTEIWGKEIKSNYAARNCNTEGDVYVLDTPALEKYEYGALYNFTADTDCVAGQRLKIAQVEAKAKEDYQNALDEYNQRVEEEDNLVEPQEEVVVLPIVVENGVGVQRPVEAGEIEAYHNYVVKYKNGQFILQGQSQIHVMCFEYNDMPSDGVIAGLKAFHGCEDIHIVVKPESRFAVEKIGVVKQVLDSGDYTNIYTTQLGIERAKYENWKTTRLQDSLTIETLYIPWLDVNQKVEYSPLGMQNDKAGVFDTTTILDQMMFGGEEVYQYLIREIQVSPLTGRMQMKLIRFFPLYPWTE